MWHRPQADASRCLVTRFVRDDTVVAKEKYSNEQIIAALKAVNGMIFLAARQLGCEPKTIYRRSAKIQAVKQAIYDSRGELVDIAEQKLRGAVHDREAWAVALVLKTLGKDRGYVERQEVTGKDGDPMAMIVEVKVVDDRAG